jgi:hypothetical protein
MIPNVQILKHPLIKYLHDIHKSIYFLCWKDDGAQLTLLAKDFGSLDCYATEFLIDGSTLSLLVSDSQKNLQVYFGISSVTLCFSWANSRDLSYVT